MPPVPPGRRPAAKAAPGKVGQRPAGASSKPAGEYAEMITGGMLTLAAMLAGVNRRSAARVVLAAEGAGNAVENLARQDKRVAKFLDKISAPTTYGAAAIPFITLGLGLAADAGLLAGTPLEHMAPPLSDDLADEILVQANIIGEDGMTHDSAAERVARDPEQMWQRIQAEAEAEREFVAAAPPVSPPADFDPAGWAYEASAGYVPNTPETAGGPG